MLDLPSGAVAVLFTDIEGFTVDRGPIDRGVKRRWTGLAMRAGQMGVNRGT
jgi:hypothetical protein